MRPDASASAAGRFAGGRADAPSGPVDRNADPMRLIDWLGVFARPYRLAMGAMVGLNLLSAVATFVELELLRSLTIVLSRTPVPADAACTFGAWARSGFSVEPVPCGARLPFLMLGIYTLIVLVQGAFDYAALAVNTRLNQAARHDVERELLRNLLLQNDAFFLRRAPSEIISRLGADLQRVGARRQMVTQAIATALSVVAVVWVLVLQSPVAAVIGVLVSLVGVLASQPLLGRLRELDQGAIEADDRVKAALEDTLGGVAEIQVSGFAPRMLAAFTARQAVRDGLAVRNADLNNLNGAAQKLTFSFGFIAVLVLFAATEIFGPLGGAGTGGLDRAALIVLLISSLPQLYFKLGELTQILSHFQVAAMSYERIAQYEAPHQFARPAQEGGSVPAGGIALRGLRYQFGPGDPVLGGPRGITCDIAATGLLGVVGPSGAGKSTLIRLLLGRQDALEGTVTFGDGLGREGRFVYLPQRPVVFDGTLRDNLLLASADGERAFLAHAPALTALGVLALVRRKGLDAFPAATDAPPRMGEIRAAFRARLGEATGGTIRPLGRDAAAPRQLVIEAQLGRAVDQGALARRMVSPLAREPVRKLASGRYGAEMAALGLAVVRRTAPLLAQASNPDDYDRIAAIRIEPEVWQLRSKAVDLASDPPGPDGKPHPLFVAVGLSTRIEETEASWPHEIPPEAATELARLVDGISAPLDPEAVNPLLTWRENLVFGAFDDANANRLAALDRVLIEALAETPLDRLVVASGLDFRVGRQGGRLSGGQQQLVALGRALISDAPFLVLDEPSSALHPQLRADLVAVLRTEARHRGVIVITHDMELARTCDRLIFVKDGAIAAEGAWDGLVAADAGFRDWVGAAAEARP